MTRAAAKLTVVPDILRGPGESLSCAVCPLSKDGKPGKAVPGEGPIDPLFIALGEGPGKTEALMGRPFIGPSGRLLERALKANGLARERVWVANSTLCLPPPGKTDALLREARECCAPRLRQELAMFPNVPILTLGGVGMQAVLGDSFKLGQIVSSLQSADVDGTGVRDIIPTHHPARILRGGDGNSTSARAVDALFLNIIYDVGKVAALGQGRDIRFKSDIEIEFESPKRARELLLAMAAEVRHVGWAAVDVETDDENARKTGLTAIAIATVNWGVSIAYPLFSSKTPAGRQAWRLLRELTQDRSLFWVFQNRIFDEQVLERYGITFAGRVDDIMLKHHATFPGASHKLQEEATQFLAVEPWKAEFRKGKNERGKADTIDNLLTYNAKDALVTARLNVPLDQCIEATDTRRVYEVDNALAPIARRMEKVGIPIYYPRNRELHAHFLEIIKRTRAEIEAPTRDEAFRKKFCDQLAVITAGKARKNDPPEFLLRHAIRMDEFYNGKRKKKNPNEFLKGHEPTQFDIGNDIHIAAYLQARGYRLSKLTPKGTRPSTAQDVLETLTRIPEVRTILEFREARKLDSTFVKNLPLDGDGDYRRCHASWLIHLITGRWASSPNWQNVPKQNMRGRPNLRSQVVAPRRRLLVGADYAQIEARLNGWLSGDPFLVSIFMDNYGKCAAGCDPMDEPVKFCPMHDIHTVFAQEVWHDFQSFPTDTKKELRDIVKRGEYGGFYGGSIETLYASMVQLYPTLTLPEVAQMVKIIVGKLTKFHTWHNDLVREAMQKGEIRTAILGRRRTFPLGNADLNVIYNFPNQAGAADIMDLGILRLEQLRKERIPDVYCELIVQGHDSVVLEVDEDAAEAVAEIVTEALSQEHTHNGLTMRFPANASIAENWKRLDFGVDKEIAKRIESDLFKITRDPIEIAQVCRYLYDKRLDPDSAWAPALEDAWHESMNTEPVMPRYGGWAELGPKLVKAVTQ